VRHARAQVLRSAAGDRRLRPRRARCRGGAGRRVLLANVVLLRRRDEITVVGAVIEATVAGLEGIGGPQGCWCTRTGAVDGCGGFRSAPSCHAARCRPGSGDGAGGADRGRRRRRVGGDRAGRGARAWVLRFGPGDSWPIANLLSGGWCWRSSRVPVGARRRDRPALVNESARAGKAEGRWFGCLALGRTNVAAMSVARRTSGNHARLSR